MAQLVGELWTSFARDGVPKAPSAVFGKAGGWPQWNGTGQQLVIDQQQLVVETAWRAEQCAHWNEH